MKNSLSKPSFALSIAAVLSAGCATSGLTNQDVLAQYDSVATLSDGVEQARGQHGNLLAPEKFEETEEYLNESIEAARNAKKAKAEEKATTGMASLKELNQKIDQHGEIMAEVVDMRERAVNQGARDLFDERLAEADESFKEASHLLEEGEMDEARDMRSSLIEKYAKLELEALKTGKVETAKKAIADAEEAEADDYAPKTLKTAKEELELVVSVLEADRTQIEKSNKHAREATWYAHRAKEIADIIKQYEKQDFSNEDIVLWYQAQLQKVRRALKDEQLPFDKANAQVILALQADAVALKGLLADMKKTNELTRQQIANLEKELDRQRQTHQAELKKLLTELQAKLAQSKQSASARVTRLEKRMSEQAQAQAEADRRERRAQQRFESVRVLFAESEAEVFRKGDNVLLRLRGFDFDSGKSEISAKNYGLLNKVVAAINTFPESQVMITGHTDSRGSDQRNLELSAARAQAVVTFLSSVGGVASSKLSAEGKGETQPLASNDTTEGRAENRRIDVLIVNESRAPEAEAQTE